FTKAVRDYQRVQIGRSGQVHVFPAPRLSGMPVAWLPRFLTVRQFLKKLEPDIVHGIRNIEGYGFMAVHSGFKNVITPHEFLTGIPRSWKMALPYRVAEWVERATYARAREVITITTHVRKEVERRCRARIFPIPNIVH